MPRYFLLALAVASVCACGSSSEPASSEPVAQSGGGEAAAPISAGSFSESTLHFGVSLWGQLRDEPGNLAVSPASIVTAVG